MKNFVKLIEQIYTERYAKVLKKIITGKIPVAFLSTTKIVDALETVKEFRKEGLNINLFITADIPRNESDFEIVNLYDAVKRNLHPEYIFVNDVTEIDARIALKNFPTSKVIDINGSTENVYDVFMTHLDNLREFYESLIDEESKKTFRGFWLGKIANRLGEVVYSNTPHYLINGFVPAAGGIIIEAGAYDGGTASVLSEMNYKVYTFEIDKLNYERTLKVAEEKDFVLEHIGLGSYKHEMSYTPSGKGNNHLTDDGTENIQVMTIDAYVREKKLPHVDMIKLDVEGAELDVLRGAVTTILRFKPILALSAYHKLDDFWTLMNFVKSLRPDYEFALRHSFDSFEDTPTSYFEEHFRIFKTFDLEPHIQGYNECVLFAR